MEDITGPNGLIQKVIKDAVEQVLRKEVNEYIADAKENGNRVSKMEAALKQSKQLMERLELTCRGHGNQGLSRRS